MDEREQPYLSVVTTLYRTEKFVGNFYARTVAMLADYGRSFEIVFVNDGSPDKALDRAVEIAKRDPRVVVLDLSRNFGQHKAMLTGLAHARGDLVFCLDSDLEEAPEDFLTLERELRRHDGHVDVVFGIQKERQGTFGRRFFGRAFFALFHFLANIEMPANQLVARIMTRRYVNALLEHNESAIFMSGLMAITGFAQVPVILEKTYKNESSYTFMGKLRASFDAIVSFSTKPLSVILVFGFAVSLIAIAVAGVYFVRTLIFGSAVEGWPSTIISIMLFGGLNIFTMGVIGLYIARIFDEVKRRPRTIVRDVYRFASGKADGREEGKTP